MVEHFLTELTMTCTKFTLSTLNLRVFYLFPSVRPAILGKYASQLALLEMAVRKLHNSVGQTWLLIRHNTLAFFGLKPKVQTCTNERWL
jgi:hypothetical protein